MAPAFAQDETTSAPSDNTLPQSESIYSVASDIQIEEAQQFFRKCSQNETMNKMRDCKCSATSYLESRVALGDQATSDEVFEKIKNQCLMKDMKLSQIRENTDIDLSDVNPKYLNEADRVYKKCAETKAMSIKVDCECYAASYLDERIKLGPMVNPDEIMIQLRGKCKNIVENTGYEYESCMTGPIVNPALQRVDKKKYCECYASTWASLYESYTGEQSARARSGLKSRAMTECTAKLLSWN